MLQKFKAVIHKSKCVFPWKASKASLIFLSYGKAYPITAIFRCFTVGQAPSLPHKKKTSLQESNTLAYYKKFKLQL